MATSVGDKAPAHPCPQCGRTLGMQYDTASGRWACGACGAFVSGPSELNADGMVQAIFAAWQARFPQHDPGDLSIDVQDDMPMVLVNQDGRGCVGAGGTIADALAFALQVAEGKRQRPMQAFEGDVVRGEAVRIGQAIRRELLAAFGPEYADPASGSPVDHPMGTVVTKYFPGGTWVSLAHDDEVVGIDGSVDFDELVYAALVRMRSRP